MAKAEMIEIAIFPKATPSAMMVLFTSIVPTGAVEPRRVVAERSPFSTWP
jgi:hypothetical protein